MLHQLNVILIGIAVVSAGHVNFYRKDYTYMQEYDAFYKLHNDGSSWNSSFLSCDDEGAELFYPSRDNEWEVAMKLVQASANHLDSVTDIFVGIHDQFFLGEYVTINGRPTNISIESVGTDLDQHCVTMNTETGAYKVSDCDTQTRPFICKKVEDISCPTIDKGYIYHKETRKCYKVNKNPKTWSKAMETCFMEGGSLLVLGSSMEADIIFVLLQDSNQYHAGFKKMFATNEFYTVKGHKLQDSGYNLWYNYENERQYECGAVHKYNSVVYLTANNCNRDNLLDFICEMEVEI